ncbi:putative type II restriction methyltransferase [Neisseria meningitidis]|uniref:Methyltransferase n=3 Tax=Neisseria meningitidis TaxID=487 RepID=X5EIT2_NEIME|nr:adenine-specific DNA-methyltransferase [Neisseria meningitidis]AHW75585.1 putative type II restriction methyltransferase [Neisseria meningitidis]AOT28699.1 methyltransferase [Neisseria meningitidis]ELL09448.1 DNA adenine methyltransferase YhdJ [Neisseria meningitidis 2004090]ELL20693.1 DNA adenine methyltransferase YhdJ [Neisseria meningitidis NM3652]ELL22761.1 DNA adenine methyltransferase YhdJ [Neisseria meningitidis NM3642]
MKKFEIQFNKNSTVILGDCLEVLKTLPSSSVDLIFADPPYGIGKDFGNNKDFFADAYQYLDWCASWIDECMRVLKDNGTMYLMSSVQYMPILDRYVDEKYFIINRIVWSYDSSGVQAKNKFGSTYEPILMFTHHKNSKYTFNSEDILIEAKTGAERKLIDYRKTPPQPYNAKKIPSNVWEFNRVRYKMDEYENHPTQKPEKLLERIILASSNKGDTILDPFSGSFTTSSVAVRLKRKAIGIEINLDYFKIGIRRTHISNEYNGEFLTKNKMRKTSNKSKKDHSKT